ncbi:hypothetical protein JY651_35750 [Pyxidicoccus parkwayensis]|uniref:DUF1565 domain-containing protein n=1 Tax=Pyxidicoccus parkwayensis TaxID=2813578 RepID=A0ABX7NSU4_9BACT|nr:hypothetical protein [Pyxidicoccus parkwaysis]QSQ20557.1 hypothetical protein JY651_35750 [Pyxidicoccus parkwaysis]
MRKTWTLGATGAALVAVLAAGGCYDFDKAQEQCLQDGRCEPEGTGPDAGDAGGGSDAGDAGDAGFDAGCTPNNNVVDVPDDAFADTDCDGVDGQADAGLFVDPAGGNDTTGTGTRQAPLRTLRHALEVLRTADGGGPKLLYLARGDYNETDLELNVPVSLHGGYTPGNGWARSADAPAQLNGGTVGLTVRNLRDAGIVLDYVNVASEDAVAASEPSIAVRMVGSSDVRLRHTVLVAGKGAPGQDGADGGAGPGGADGGSGTPASGAIAGNAGSGGSTTCGVGGTRSGGLGGSGVLKTAGETGQPGTPAPPAGGSPGKGGDAGEFTCPGGDNCTCTGFPGLDGGVGTSGGTGPSGSAGSGMGTVQGETWRPSPEQTGGNGDVGEAGAGGGGGGSGGSCPNPTVSVAGSGGGGGGGAGGCGGTGGKGGTGGGASIALLLIDSQVSLEEGTRLTTRGGGNGGRGGNGGPGGAGGAGGSDGAGSNLMVPGSPAYNSFSGRGGRGGPGGSGGNGGPGGGGGGGPSVGVWCDATTQLGVATTGVTISPGNGGAGGDSQGGNTGGVGQSVDKVGCPLNP